MTFAADRPSQPYPRLFPWLMLSAALLVAIGSVHWRFQEVPLGVLYVLPMLAAALVLNRWQVILFGVLLAIVRSAFLPSEPLGGTALRFLLGLAAYAATGLFVVEMVRNKTLWLRYHQEISAQEQLVVEAQTDLKMLAESSPAAIFTLDDQARVVSGNQAASALFGVTPEALLGHQAKESLPVLADALKFSPGTPTFRTAAQCQGQRADGERFLAQTWFSTYDTSTGRRLAAIAVDISDEIRDREEQNLRQLLTNNWIVAAAVSHEIRNVCSAIELVYRRLSEAGTPGASSDFETLGSLVKSLGKVATLDLQRRSTALDTVDLAEILDQLRIIVEPDWKDLGGTLDFAVPRSLPRVLGESYGILQVLMNLSQNSVRACRTVEERAWSVSFSATAESAFLRVADSGPGVADPSVIFEPFRSGSGQPGLGLFLSRAILRSYGGDLKYEPSARGATFVLELAAGVSKGRPIG